MKFGSREICNVVFKAKTKQTIGNNVFMPGQPVLYIDSAKTSNMEGAATTVYATGGRGNSRLIAWEGEKTLTFTVEDALLSPISFSMLSGAGLIKGKDNTTKVHVHATTMATITKNSDDTGFDVEMPEGVAICAKAPVFILKVEADGSLTGTKANGAEVSSEGALSFKKEGNTEFSDGDTVFVDYYVVKDGNKVSELQIDAGHFAGNYYVEANTLFRRQIDGFDMPAEITFPNVKIQSNFTFAMAASGDPSTFSFTMDALPGYTYFDSKTKVLCVIQIVEEADDTASAFTTVMPHSDTEALDTITDVEGDGGKKTYTVEEFNDSIPPATDDVTADKWTVDETSGKYTYTET